MMAIMAAFSLDEDRVSSPVWYSIRVILVRTPDVKQSQEDLQADQCVRVIMPTPDDPQCVAEQKDPEAEVAPALGQRSDEPCRRNRGEHRRPLDKVEIVHL